MSRCVRTDSDLCAGAGWSTVRASGTPSPPTESSGWEMSRCTCSPLKVGLPARVAVARPDPRRSDPPLCPTGNYDLHVDTEDFQGNRRFAEYKNFLVDDEQVSHDLVSPRSHACRPPVQTKQAPQCCHGDGVKATRLRSVPPPCRPVRPGPDPGLTGLDLKQEKLQFLSGFYSFL